jgi:hypothetical protein
MVVAVTGGLIYSLKVDPELMLKIPSLFVYLSFFLKRPYQEILNDAKKDKTNVIVFWVVVLAVLLLGFIAIRLTWNHTGGTRLGQD